MGSLRSASTGISKPAQWVWRLCLLASLWRAPVPWVHSHEEMPVAMASVGFWVEHFDHFHPVGSRPPCGWHLHYVWPWQLADESGGSDGNSGQIPDSLRLQLNPTTWAPPGDGVDKAPSIPAGLLVTLHPGIRGEARHQLVDGPVGLQVLVSYSHDLSWRALASVARC